MQVEKYDAVMILVQADLSQVTEMRYFQDLPFRDISLDQAIGIQFFDSNDIENELWQAMITMNISLTREKSFEDLSKLILKSMKENLICN